MSNSAGQHRGDHRSSLRYLGQTGEADPQGKVQDVSVAVGGGDLLPAFDLFITVLEGESNGNLAPQVPNEGHRRINWDGAAVPFAMPGDFFAKGNVDHGLTIYSDKNQFRVSNPVVAASSSSWSSSSVADSLFDSINPLVSQDLVTFPPPRLFSPFLKNKIKLAFMVPGGEGSKALVSGFGGIFVDMDQETLTKIED